MSNSSEGVKRWRRKTKSRMCKAFDDKCCICKNTFPPEVFDFHHIDPSEKVFGLGGLRANAKSWKKVVIELRKCVMMCANCHRLTHSQGLKIPKGAKRFNEVYTDYKRSQRRIRFCSACRGEIDRHNKEYCSQECYNKSKRKFKLSSKELEKLVWEKPSVHIAKQFGVSDVAVAKRCKKLGIKKPPRGYWVKRRARMSATLP